METIALYRQTTIYTHLQYTQTLQASASSMMSLIHAEPRLWYGGEHRHINYFLDLNLQMHMQTCIYAICP